MATSDGERADQESGGERAREGLEHLQTAVREMIAAARAFLDAVDDLVEDPHAVAAIKSTVSSVARLAGGALSGRGLAGPDDDSPKVERITVK